MMKLYKVTHRVIETIEIEAIGAIEAEILASKVGPWEKIEDYYEAEEILP